MKRYLFTVPLLVLLFNTACKQTTPPVQDTTSPINNILTSEEKAAGVMTPEIMWKFRRLGTFALSPDGSTVLYTVTDIDLQTEARITNIYKIPSSGGEPVQLTASGGSSPQWFDYGKSIAFISKGTLHIMNADGSDQKAVQGLSDFEIYNISPTGNNIYFTKRIKLDQTANEKHNFPNANVRIINDLMYRHWNYWSDYSTVIYLLHHLMELRYRMQGIYWKIRGLNHLLHPILMKGKSPGALMVNSLLIHPKRCMVQLMQKVPIQIFTCMN